MLYSSILPSESPVARRSLPALLILLILLIGRDSQRKEITIFHQCLSCVCFAQSTMAGQAVISRLKGRAFLGTQVVPSAYQSQLQYYIYLYIYLCIYNIYTYM